MRFDLWKINSFHWYLMMKWVCVACFVFFNSWFRFDLPTKEIIRSLWRRKGYRRRENVPKQTISLFIFSTERSVLFCTVIQSFVEVIHYREIHLQSCLQSSVVPERQSDFDLLLSFPSQHYFKDFQAEQLSLFSVESLQPAFKG